MRAIPEYPSMPHSPGMMCTSGIRRVATTPSPRSSTSHGSSSRASWRTLRAERPQGAPDGARRRRPDVVAVPSQHAAEDPRQHARRRRPSVASRACLHGPVPPVEHRPCSLVSGGDVVDHLSFGDGHLRLRGLPGDVHTTGRGRVRRPRRRRRWRDRRGDVHRPALGDRAGARRARRRDDPDGRPTDTTGRIGAGDGSPVADPGGDSGRGRYRPSRDDAERLGRIARRELVRRRRRGGLRARSSTSPRAAAAVLG